MNHIGQTATARANDVQIRSGAVMLQGDLIIPTGAQGLVLFAHGSGSSRHSPRNQFVARTIREAGVGTLLFDLLTPDEEAIDARTGHLRFDSGAQASCNCKATAVEYCSEQCRNAAEGQTEGNCGHADCR